MKTRREWQFGQNLLARSFAGAAALTVTLASASAHAEEPKTTSDAKHVTLFDGKLGLA